MDQQQLMIFSQLLLRQKEQLLALDEIGKNAARTVELDQTRVDRLSRMDAMQGQAMSQEMNRRRQLELEMIVAALRRVETGDYGCCVECDAEIASKRLELNPATALCIDCASRAEAG